jgi:hypothetical protein
MVRLDGGPKGGRIFFAAMRPIYIFKYLINR